MSTSIMSEDEIRAAAGLLSPERLAGFVKVTGTEQDAIEVHGQSVVVAAAIMPALCLIEIALRNAICERLRATLGVPDWISTPPFPIVWKGSEDDKIKDGKRQAQRAAYTKMAQAEKKALDALAYPGGVPKNISHERLSKSRQKQITITTGSLIAQLTLFFWKRLFSTDYETSLWKPSLRGLFPNKKLSRAIVADHLEVLYQARNRIAHHEPIMGARLKKVIEAIEFLALNFGTKQPSEEGILAKMTVHYRQTLVKEAAALATLMAKFTVEPPA